MFKFLFFLYCFTLVSGFFIDGSDIRKLFGIPSFFEVYRKEGSENYEVENEDQYHRYKDRDEDEEQSKVEIIYPRRNKHNEDVYNRENSNRNEQIYKKCAYEKNDRKKSEGKLKEKRREELKEQIEDERRETLNKLKKKDYVTGILVALPKFSDDVEKNHEFYIVKDNVKQYFKTIDKEAKE